VPNAYDNLLNASQGLDQILPRFAELEPMCAPGSCYTYQNVLFCPGRTGDRAFDRAFLRGPGRTRCIEPLDMRNASVGMAGYLAAPDRASPHARRFRGGPWWPTEVNENYYRVAPAAGVNASMRWTWGSG
jgi:beta-lactamase class C